MAISSRPISAPPIGPRAGDADIGSEACPLRTWRSPLPELLLAAWVVLLYGDALTYGYIWDDHWLVTLDLAGALESSWRTPHVRPVWYLSFVLSQRLGTTAELEHLLNLCLFALSVVLAYRLALAYLDRRPAAWGVATVWSLLPWNAYPALWIAQRNDLLVFVFAFAALLAQRRRRWWVAWLLLCLAVFSKPIVAFVPLLFAWKAREHQRHGVAWGFIGLFLGYQALAIRAYVLFMDLGNHLQDLPLILRLLRFPLHWLEHFALLALPLPFFLGAGHALVYVGGVVILLLASRATDRGSRSPSRDLWCLALLASLPAAVTPELRICGFESLFWLLLLVRARRFPWPAALALVMVLGAYGGGLRATKAIFDMRAAPAATAENARRLYPNDYYRLRRSLLAEIVTAIRPRQSPASAVR